MLDKIIVGTDGKNAGSLKMGSTYLICRVSGTLRDPLFIEVAFGAEFPAEFFRSLKESTMRGEQEACLAACRGSVTEYQPESAGHMLLDFKEDCYLFEILTSIDFKLFSGRLDRNEALPVDISRNR